MVSPTGAYVRVRRLPAGGTFTPGTDWSGQFDTDPTVVVSAVATSNGEIAVPEDTLSPLLVLTSRVIGTTAPLTGGGDLSADRTLGALDFVASGASHARGTVPDPGASAGSSRFLKEDATWAEPVAPATTLFLLMGA